MDLFLGQLVCTKFPEVGLRILTSAQVPTVVQQAFIQQVASRHWGSDNRPLPGHQAAFLHQVTPEHCLFGWLYNEGLDDIDSSYVPYFICYYLEGPLYAFQLETIFTCLYRGPLALIDRHSLPTSLETMVVPDLSGYQPARLGVAIPLGVRKGSHIKLKQGELLDLFVPIINQDMGMELNDQIYEQQIVNLSIYRRYIIEGIETGAPALNGATATIDIGVFKPDLEDKKKLQQYEQALVETIQRQYPISDKTRSALKRLQKVLRFSSEVLEPTRVFKADQEYKKKLQQYEQVLVEAIQRETFISNKTRNSLERWQQFLRLTDEDIEPIEASIAQQTKRHCYNQSIMICACWLVE